MYKYIDLMVCYVMLCCLPKLQNKLNLEKSNLIWHTLNMYYLAKIQYTVYVF